MRIVVPDCLDDPIVEKAFASRLSGFPDAAVHRTRPAHADELVQRVADAECILLPFEAGPLTAEVLKRARELRVVSIAGAYTGCVDVDAARDLGIIVRNTPQAATPAVAEITVGLMLALARRLPSLNTAVQNGDWPRTYGHDIDGKVLGLIGLGAIGQRVAKAANALGMTVIAWSPRLTEQRAAEYGSRWRPLDRLMSEADYISLHLRLADDTAGLIDRDRLALMKPSAALVNTARAALLDEDALWEMLRDRRIAAAALDVFGAEPLPTPNRWQGLENVILTPHCAWRTTDTLDRFIDRAISNALEALSAASA